jgi:hypothetical protein
MAIEVTIHGTGSGTCSLTGKTGDGLTVTFKDGTVTEAFLSWKGFQQILALKAGKNGKALAVGRAVTQAVGETVSRANGEAVGRTESVGVSTGHSEGISTSRTVSTSSTPPNGSK